MGFVGWGHGTLHGREHRRLVEKLDAQGKLDADELTTEGEQVEVVPA